MVLKKIAGKFAMSHLSNMIAIIKIGVKSKQIEVGVQNTSLNINVLNSFYKLGYIRGFSVKNKKFINVFLKYQNNKSVIRNINVISTPGRRLYVTLEDLKKVNRQNDSGLYLLSTNKGVLCDQESLLFGVGGELLLKIS